MSRTFASLLLLFGHASAFAPPVRTSLVSALCKHMASSDLNGWEPNEQKFAWGLPGAIAPFNDGFDPVGLSTALSLAEMKRYREAEVSWVRSIFTIAEL